MSSIKCPKCGFDSVSNANFCFNCGMALKNPMPPIEYAKEKKSQFEIDSVEGGNIIEETSTSQIIIDQEPLNEVKVVEENLSSEMEDDQLKGDTECDAEEENKTDEVQLPSEETKIDEEVAGEESMVNECAEKTHKILGIPEWAFYSSLLIIGVVVVIGIKVHNEPQWLENIFTINSVKSDSIVEKNNEQDTVSIQKIEAINDSVANIKNADIDTAPIKQDTALVLPSMSGRETDTAYHVVITTIKDEEKAKKIAKESSYKDAYVISQDGKYRIAVFRSLKKEEAQIYMDSIIKKDHPDAWLFRGVVK